MNNDMERMKQFCRERGLDWPGENLSAGDWAERVMRVLAAVLAEVQRTPVVTVDEFGWTLKPRTIGKGG